MALGSRINGNLVRRLGGVMLSSTVLLGAASLQPALAQDVIQLDTVTVTLDENGNPIGQGTGPGEANEQEGFVATRSAGATKTNTPIIETPQSISVVTSDQIERQDARTIRAATRYTAGVTPEITGGADTRCGGFNIRGFDSTANATFFDGLRLPSSSIINFLCLDPYGAERIEILKGPSSVLYGQNGPGGLINYVSKKPTDAPLREVEISGGSFGLLEGRFDLSGPAGVDSPFGFRLTGVARNSENQVDTVDDDRFFIAPAMSWEPDAQTSLTVSGNYQRDRAGWGLQFMPASGTLTDNDGRRIPNSRFLGEPDFDHYDTDMGSIGYQFSHEFNDTFTFRQNARYAGLSHDEASIYGGGYIDEAAGLLARSGGTGDVGLDTFSIDNQVQAEFDTGILGHTLLGGLDYRKTRYTDTVDLYGADPINVFDPVYGSPVTRFGNYYDNTVDQTQTGLYLQDQIKLDRLSLVLSGRYDWATTALERPDSDFLSAVDAERDADAFTGRVGLIYNFDNGIAPYVTYSESFLPPLDVSATGGLFEPEEARQYEAGIKYEPAGWNTLLTASVFDIVRDNAIRFDAVGGTFQARQTGQITSRGFELEGVASLTDSLNLRLAYTYLDAEITEDPDGGLEGMTPTTIPRHTVSGWADYTIRNGSMFDGLGAGLGVRYVGSSYGDDANSFKVPSATVVDAVLSYERDNYEVSVNASNLFDKEYVASCGNADFYCFYGEGRRITGKATIRW
ncbi:TonB-dependent siderophore receptor [Aurantimonas sp. HBX-1]|uniref:TonB-dependent siderophore receptor n=1 Tax=Aurantimonas sp. HBX-1 TaxID=2906072 RepID=UPI001F351EEA|nr:TonB-dependent siderophore receptor [Aurantimonas sp. HBX-1]UIJ72134.1 TonB-dependent siderophore receptor [Aurantimonas sp. HBX-1]